MMLEEEGGTVKQEVVEPAPAAATNGTWANHDDHHHNPISSNNSVMINGGGLGNNVVIPVSDSSSSSSGSSSSSSGSSLFNWDTDSDYNSDDNEVCISSSTRRKKQRTTSVLTNVLPVGFLDPLRPEDRLAMQQHQQQRAAAASAAPIIINPSTTMTSSHHVRNHQEAIKEEEPLALVQVDSCVGRPGVLLKNNIEINRRAGGGGGGETRRVKQFWKAGDCYEASCSHDHDAYPNSAPAESVGMEHVRVHPKFLHSNATSHKWALGAFAELLDNALDEVCNGATYVHIDMLKNNKDNDNAAMLLVEDDGGGMTPDKIRQCMSLGYSAKTKSANTIGQYPLQRSQSDGNGFKTSTMRLGADVIVFSRCQGKDGRSSTQSIGMLSYTFLTETGKEDTVVPMIDYEKRGEGGWHMMIRSTSDDWKRNLDTVVQWSPYDSEQHLLSQFNYLKDQGTRIIVYNLWEDDQGSAELDFDSDKYDIQIRGVNRDEKKIEMAKTFPNLKHYLTYRHSLRNYAAILYLRIPPRFRIILRGKDVEHYNIINDMRYSKEVTYRPAGFPDEAPKDPNMCALLTIGFTKDADSHVDVQGFNVYHKNRLIKPFWRVWNAAGSDGRGVIGVLEANFVEPAHDKQGFERTIAFSRLENRLVVFQKDFWSTHCHLIGYAKRRNKSTGSHKGKTAASPNVASKSKAQFCSPQRANFNSNSKYDGKSPAEDAGEDEMAGNEASFSSGKTLQPECLSNQKADQVPRQSFKKTANNINELASVSSTSELVYKLKEDNHELKTSLEEVLQDLHYAKERNNSLENQIQEMEQMLKESNRETEEEMHKRDLIEEGLRNKLRGASDVIEELCNKIKILEMRRTVHSSCKREI